MPATVHWFPLLFLIEGLGMSINDYVRWFSDIRVGDVALVGGKNASLGELYSTLSKQGVRVPNGFALTADAYWDALTAAKAWERLHALLDRKSTRLNSSHLG